MSSYVLSFQDIDTTKTTVVGGKGANLGELSRIEGILAPDGFCISTEAFREIIEATPPIHELLNQLALLKWRSGTPIACKTVLTLDFDIGCCICDSNL